jgi:hypothetical protein
MNNLNTTKDQKFELKILKFLLDNQDDRRLNAIEAREMIDSLDIKRSLDDFNEQSRVFEMINNEFNNSLQSIVERIPNFKDTISIYTLEYWNLLLLNKVRVEIKMNKEFNSLIFEEIEDMQISDMTEKLIRLKNSLLQSTNITFKIFVRSDLTQNNEPTSFNVEQMCETKFLTTNQILLFKECIKMVTDTYILEEQDNTEMKQWFQELEKMLSIKLNLIPDDFQENLVNLLNSDRMNLSLLNCCQKHNKGIQTEKETEKQKRSRSTNIKDNSNQGKTEV